MMKSSVIILVVMNNGFPSDVLNQGNDRLSVDSMGLMDNVPKIQN